MSSLRRAGPLAAAGVAANGLAVVLTVALARLLAPREYGATVQLLGLLLVLQMPGSALVVGVVRRVTAWQSAGLGSQLGSWVAEARRLAVAGLVAGALAALLARGWVASVLGLPGPGGVTELLMAGACWTALSFERGLLQSRLAFPVLARNLALEALARTVFTLGLVTAGLGVTGAAGGVLGGVATALAHARRAAGRLPSPDRERGRGLEPVVGEPPAVPWGSRRGQLAGDLVAALAALGLLAGLQSLDVLVVGREAPASSGDYGAVSVASKALVFLAVVLSAYLLPEVATRWHRGEGALRPLGAAVGLVAVPALGLAGIGALVPRAFLRLFFGPGLVGAAPALLPLTLAMACLAATVLCTHYLLGTGERQIVSVLAVAAAVTAAALTAARGHPVATARTDLVCQAVLALLAGALVARVVARGARSTRVRPATAEAAAG